MFKKVEPYIKIARIDHWIKNIFILPGSFLALFFTEPAQLNLFTALNFLIGCIAVCITASANYVINEFLDNLDIEFNLGTKSKQVLDLLNNQYDFINEDKDVDMISFCFECEYFNAK